MSFLTSSIGRKQLMGLSGLVMVGFVVGHMAGNLTMFLGPEAYNTYGHTLLSNKLLLYGTEVALVLALLIHFIMGIWLTRENRAARKSKYAMSTHGEKAARFASKSMIYHGVALLGFIIWHLCTFKFGNHYNVTYNGVLMRDLFSLLVEKFNQPLYLVGYLVLMVAVGVHVNHGFYSAWQSLGVNHPRYTPKIKKISIALALVVAVGFMSQPIYIFFLH